MDLTSALCGMKVSPAKTKYKEPFKIHVGDCLSVLKKMDSNTIDCCVTSPPYWGLRDYGVDGQVGLEESLSEYIEKLTGIFEEVRRVLKSTGTLWLNLGDSYNGGGSHCRRNS